MTRRFLLVLVGILLALGCLELGARTRYSAPWYDQLIAEQEHEPKAIPRNRYGLRGPDYAHPKPPDCQRVFVIGDSFTAGSWVGDEQVFTRLLEARFQSEQPISGVTRYEFLNGGVAGTLTQDWVHLYQRVGPSFEPDLVLIVFFLRDGTRLAAKRDFIGPIREEYTVRNEGSRLYQLSFLYRTIRDRWDKDEILERYASRFQDSYFGDESATAEWRLAQVQLRRLHELAMAQGAKVGFVIFPMLVYLEEAQYPFQAIVQTIQQYAEAEGMPTHDLLSAFRGQKSQSLWLSPLNQHPNTSGHTLAAESLYPFVLQLLAGRKN